MIRRLTTTLAIASVLVATLAGAAAASATVIWDVKTVGDSAQGWLSIERGVAAWDSFDGIQVWRSGIAKTAIVPGTSRAIVSDVVVSNGQVFWLETVGDYWSGRGIVHVWRPGEGRARVIASRPHIQRGSLRVAGRRLCWSEGSGSAPFSRWRTRTLDDKAVQQIPKLADGAADLSLAENVLAFGMLDWTRRVAALPLGMGGADGRSSLPAPNVIARAPDAMYLTGTLSAAGDRVAWAARTKVDTSTVMTWNLGKSAPSTLGTDTVPGQAIAVSPSRLAWARGADTGIQTIMTQGPGSSAAAAVAAYPSPLECYGLRSSGGRLIWFASSDQTSTLYSWGSSDPEPSAIPVSLSHGTAELSEDIVAVVGETFAGGDTKVYIARPVGEIPTPAPRVPSRPLWDVLVQAVTSPTGVAWVVGLTLAVGVLLVINLIVDRR